MEEQHRRWGCPLPPIPRYQFSRMLWALPTSMPCSRRAKLRRSHTSRTASLQSAFSSITTRSISHSSRRVRPCARKTSRCASSDLAGFRCAKARPGCSKPSVSSGARHPTARLLLPRQIAGDMRPVLPRFADVPIEWLPVVPLAQLARIAPRGRSVRAAFDRRRLRPHHHRGAGLRAARHHHAAHRQAGTDRPRPQRRDRPHSRRPALAEAICRWATIVLARAATPAPLLDPAELGFAAFQMRLLAALERGTG